MILVLLEHIYIFLSWWVYDQSVMVLQAAKLAKMGAMRKKGCQWRKNIKGIGNHGRPTFSSRLVNIFTSFLRNSLSERRKLCCPTIYLPSRSVLQREREMV